MYKGMLDNPELVRRLANKSDDGSGGGNANADTDADVASASDETCQFPLKIRSSGTAAGVSVPIESLVDNNIDTIFVKITELYHQEDYTIIYHTLQKIQGDPQYYMNYIEGLNKILEPVNIRIKKWIDDNIVF